MSDQARGLRILAQEARPGRELDPSVVAAPRSARVVAVTSGKGGVGKTSVCANLALLLARAGRSVLVFDADLGLANVHVMLGLAPRWHLEHVLRGERTLREVILPGPGGIQILPGGSGIVELADLDSRRRQQLIRAMLELDDLADVILVDTGAGLSRSVLAFALAAGEAIVVTTPEPTALTDAYAVVKALSRERRDMRLRLLVNMAAGDADARAASERLTLVARQFLGIELETLGFVPLDAALPRSVRAQAPLALAHPGAPAARALERVARSLGGEDPGRRYGAHGFLNRVLDILCGGSRATDAGRPENDPSAGP